MSDTDQDQNSNGKKKAGSGKTLSLKGLDPKALQKSSSPAAENWTSLSISDADQPRSQNGQGITLTVNLVVESKIVMRSKEINLVVQKNN